MLCSLSGTGYHQYFLFNPSDRGIIVSHCSFNLHIFNDEWCWASFYVYLSSVYHLWWNVYSNEKIWLFSYRLLSYTSFIRYVNFKYLSQSVACLFTYFIVSFTFREQNFKIWKMSTFSICFLLWTFMVLLVSYLRNLDVI